MPNEEKPKLKIDFRPTPKQQECLEVLNDKTTRFILFGGSKGCGKALDIETDLVTPQGWKKMRDLEIGDQVFDEKGQPCWVTNCTGEMFDHDVYRITFDNDDFIDADASHLWEVKTFDDRQKEFR